jgi:uncharacterized protein YjiS (DUF1127 family)
MNTLKLDPFNPRLPCECCGYLTIMAAVDRYDSFEPSETLWACPLCDWENAPLRADGSLDADAPSAEERNGGSTLEQARANFRTHAWMYDPERPEPWMVAPPAPTELELRRALREAYEALRTTAEPDQYDLWRQIAGYERALRDLGIRRAQAAEGEPDSPAA